VVWNGTTVINPADKEGFLALIKELRTAFNANDLLLSVDISGSKGTIKKAYDVESLSEQVRLCLGSYV